MPKINASIKNTTSNDYVVHVYDLFGGGHEHVAKLNLAEDEVGSFSASASGDGQGRVEYRVDGGPSLSNIEIVDGDVIEI